MLFHVFHSMKNSWNHMRDLALLYMMGGRLGSGVNLRGCFLKLSIRVKREQGEDRAIHIEFASFYLPCGWKKETKGSITSTASSILDSGNGCVNMEARWRQWSKRQERRTITPCKCKWPVYFPSRLWVLGTSNSLFSNLLFLHAEDQLIRLNEFYSNQYLYGTSLHAFVADVIAAQATPSISSVGSRWDRFGSHEQSQLFSSSFTLSVGAYFPAGHDALQIMFKAFRSYIQKAFVACVQYHFLTQSSCRSQKRKSTKTS